MGSLHHHYSVTARGVKKRLFWAENPVGISRARYYDPAVGRFVSEDPKDIRSDLYTNAVNLYAYADNNPINRIDPLGLWSITFGLYAGAGGEITFGKDNGNWFATGRVGIGLGGGISYDPNGGIPGPAIKNPSVGGLVLSDSTQVGFNAGPISASIEGGVARNYSNRESSPFGGLSYGGTAATGIGAGASIGAQATIYRGCNK
jgi:RHS repeat-associated protein